MPCRCQCHRPLDSIQLCFKPPPPSSSSCTWSLPSTFPSPNLFSKCCWVGPLPLQLYDVHWNACLAILSSDLLIACPSHFHFLLRSCSCTGSLRVFFYSSSLDILSGQCTFTIFRRHLLTKTCNLYNVLCVTVQDSDAWNKTAFTLELNILIFVRSRYSRYCKYGQ